MTSSAKMFRAADLRRFPLGFSTLGCPDASLSEALSLCHRFGMDFLELRALEGKLDLPEFLAAERVVEECRKANVAARVVGSSFLLSKHTADSVPKLWATCAWASAIGAQYVRVFAGGKWPIVPDNAGEELARALLKEFSHRKDAEGWTCDLALETHDSLSSARSCRAFLDHIETPLAILWDTHHTWRLGGETPAESWDILGPHVVHLHVKDSSSIPSGKQSYTDSLPGAGEYPAEELMTVLSHAPTTLGISLEWERKWHPELPPLEDALERWL